jgi:hypothetical protein
MWNTLINNRLKSNNINKNFFNDRLLTAHRVLRIVNCCSLIFFFDFIVVISGPRANGLKYRKDVFDRFRTSHRKIKQ